MVQGSSDAFVSLHPVECCGRASHKTNDCCLPRYTSVRIDAVHYCELEAVLSEKRHRRTLLHHSSVEGASDIPGRRLSLFCRTVRESVNLAQQVEILKLPYMTRETSKGEMAATVSVLPNLQYVDLPEGAFEGDPSCHTLVNELMARCSRIRRMTYRKGAEQYLESLTDHHWSALEELEISGIAIEPSLLRMILGSLPSLRSLALMDLQWMNDTVFDDTSNLASFPRLDTFIVEDCPHITSAGFKKYLSQQRNRDGLARLQLRRTGITLSSLTEFLYDATSLKHLTFIAKVNFSDTLPLASTPRLASISLQVLNFEITDAEGHAPSLSRPSAAFYTYLARSLHSNSLPALRTLYVRDITFPDLLLQPPTRGPNGAPVSTLASPLEVFSKGLDEAEWIYTIITQGIPPQHTSSSDPSSNTPSLYSSGGRPLSAYDASRGLGPQWGSPESIVVGNGFGGYLAVPRDDYRPGSEGSDRVGLLAPPSSNGMSAMPRSATTPRLGYQSTLAPTDGWPAAIIGSAPSDGRFASAFSSRPLSVGHGASAPSAWPAPVIMQSGIGPQDVGSHNKFSGLMAKVGVPVRGKKPQKYDLWR